MFISEIVTELFQRSKAWQWEFRGSEEAFANFKIGEVDYLWYARVMRASSPKQWTLGFKQRDQGFDYEKEFGLAGTGNSAEVMSTVVDITRTFLSSYGDKVEEIRFTSAEPSRTKLYARMVKRLLPNWDLHTKLIGGETGFYLINPAAYNTVDEEILDEMPLPTDWDPAQMQQQGTSFKSRLAYALERAKKLGTGSSRVAMIIEYEGRPTVLKVAKNAKGLAQNSVEADILSDGYASQLGILIPIIDYDEQHREPLWIHTELAQKVTDKQLCAIMKCDSLELLVRFANTIAGKYRGITAQTFVDGLLRNGKSEQDIETMTEYANVLADLHSSFDVELADFARKANWGMYQGKPVVIDVGFNSNVMNQYYK